MELTARVQAVLRHGQFVNGPEVGEFERAMARYIGVGNAVALNSGTDALILALRVLGVGEGDVVALPAFTFSATASAAAMCGAIIHLADIRESDFGIDVNTLSDPDVLKAMIAVDMFGIPCDWPSVIDICATHRIHLVEDAAQAIGARFAGAKCGSIGMIGCASFYPSKPLPCAGDGGMLFTNYDSIAQRARMLANHGRVSERRYEAERVGTNSRLDTIQAAVLLDRLKVFESREIPWRIAQAQEYGNRLPACRHHEPRPGREPVWSWYPVLYESRKERDDVLQNYGGYVGARVIYPTPIHLMPAFEYLGYRRGDFPVAESVCERILAFPIVHHWEVNRCLSTIGNAESAAVCLR
jgi:dTDP-4-amino-4,6-dideoxygalactose transaminase